jgi:hypothetical protein
VIRENFQTAAMVLALMLILAAVLTLHAIGKPDPSTIGYLVGGVTTLAGALAGFSQHKPNALPPGTRTQEISTVEPPPPNPTGANQ